MSGNTVRKRAGRDDRFAHDVELYHKRKPCILDTGKAYMDRHWWIQPFGAFLASVFGMVETLRMLHDIGANKLLSFMVVISAICAYLFTSLVIERLDITTHLGTSSTAATNDKQISLQFANARTFPSSLLA